MAFKVTHNVLYTAFAQDCLVFNCVTFSFLPSHHASQLFQLSLAHFACHIVLTVL
jgi:hypothetical protein